MKATLVVRRKLSYSSRDFAELVVWRVPTSVPPSSHPFKYRLVYVVNGVRVIGFDNERGKGDHRHDKGIETAYRFRGVERLIADFTTAVNEWRSAHDEA